MSGTFFLFYLFHTHTNMKMKQGFLSLICIIIFQGAIFAQTHEIGFTAGVANYSGELAPVFNITSPGPQTGLFYRYNMGTEFSARINFSFAQISANDANSDDAFAQARNHLFETGLIELGAQLEYNFLDFRNGNRRVQQNWSPYVFLGLAFLKFSPQENGQPTYNTRTASIPLGLGLKARLGDNWNIGFEFGSRFTFTDFLDDLGVEANAAFTTPRNPKYFTGNTNNNDVYHFTSLTISYVFPDSQKDCPVKLPR